MRNILKGLGITVIILCLGFLLYSNVKVYFALGEAIKDLTDVIEIYKVYNIETLNKILTFFEKQISKTVIDADKLRESNVLIYNVTAGYVGAGTYVKVGKDYYILSCAHLIKDEADKLVAVLDDKTVVPLIKVKVDETVDLSLWITGTTVKLNAVEIAEYIPRLGTEVRVIGNPDCLTDVITDGIIARYLKNGYLLTAKSFGGNSGGAVIDTRTGKLVGVLTQGYIMMRDDIFESYSWAVNIDTIKEFIKDYEK